MYTVTVTPYRVVFIETDDLQWTIAELSINALFSIDLVFNFFTPYYDIADCLVVKRRLIIRNYLTSWFFVDLLSCFPFQLFSTPSLTSLLSRFPRLYRLLKLAK